MSSYDVNDHPALAGGYAAGGQSDPSGQLPPELMAALMGGGGGPMGGGPQAPPASEEDRIRAVLSELRDLLGVDGLSEAERLLLQKVAQLLQQLPAGREKEQQAALGGGLASNFLRRTSGA